MDSEAIRALLTQQAGVISRQQVLACGGNDRDLARLLRRQVLHRLHTGVFIDHNGPPTWEQQGWGAVLRFWPAVVAGPTALVAHGLRLPRFLGRPATSRIEVASMRDGALARSRKFGCGECATSTASR